VNRLLVLAVALLPFVYGQEKQVSIDPAATEIHWILPGNVHTVHGTFKLKRGQLRFNPETGAASGELVADATSGESGSKDRDSKMHSSVIESQKYSEIVFMPDKVIGAVNLAGESTVQIHGRFRIHGTEQEATLPATTHIEGTRIKATLHFPIPYVQWKMKNPSNFLFRVNPAVDIEIQAVGTIAP